MAESQPQDAVISDPAVAEQMSLTEQLLDDVKNFADDLGITESLVGTRAVGDSQIIGRLREGRSITLRSAERLYAYMSEERARRGMDEISADRRRRARWWARMATWLNGGNR